VARLALNRAVGARGGRIQRGLCRRTPSDDLIDHRVHLRPRNQGSYGLKVQDKETYAWVECGSCATAWQVPHHAA
jgi:hypothetical protein